MTKLKIAELSEKAEQWLPENKPDGSQIGINYADAYIKPMNRILENGTQVSCKRRGLKITIAIGDKKGEALMNRFVHGPEVKDILQGALNESAQAAGATFSVEDGIICLEVSD